MKESLIRIARLHYRYGLIGIDEFSERIHIARWLSDSGFALADPRVESGETSFANGEAEVNSSTPESDLQGVERSQSTIEPSNEWIEFTCLNTWVFTKADPDPFPSVPHGHFKSQNNKWPKLNPYTGRVFMAKHQEDKTRRLSKDEMRKIWRDREFREFCLEMIRWYRIRFPHHPFPIGNGNDDLILRLPRW